MFVSLLVAGAYDAIKVASAEFHKRFPGARADVADGTEDSPEPASS